MAGTTDGLRLFSQSIFNPPADSPSLVAACPTIDLTAAVSGGNAVYIRRRGGEIVSKLTERNKEVQAVAWKSDGQFLAVAWSDGVVRLTGLESPKAVHQIRLFDGTPVAITYISWTKNLVGSRESWQGNLLETQDDEQSSDVLDLPRALMFLEVEDDLPRLLPLPVSGGSGDDMFVFSTRTSLEFMFPPLKPRDGDSIHVMVLGTADGVIHVSIYDTFVMGTFTAALPPNPDAVNEEGRTLLQLRQHASHPASSTHALLLANEDADNRGVYLALMDLTFIYSSPLDLSLLAFKTTTFQKLLRYIKQTQVHMQGEWQTARELPSRFLANIQEDLQQERRHKNIDHALRVAALTGYVSPTLKQWLVDTIAERGHKRWDKAVVGGLQNLRDLIHENMMPALDRAMLALSRLRGLAEFHSNDDIGFSADQISQLMDMISCLILVSHNALALVTAELELFVIFSTWLRSLIERLALPGQAEEQAEKEPNLSMTPVLDYITNHMLRSPLDLHFGKTSEADWSADWRTIEEGSGELLDKLEAEMEKVDGFGVKPDMLGILQDGFRKSSSRGKENQPVQATRGDETKEKETDPEDKDEEVSYMKAFPKFEFLTKLFSTHADRVLKDIAESGRRHVHFGPLTRISVDRPIKKAEVAMTAISKSDLEESANALVFTAFTSTEDSSTLYVFHSSVTTAEGISTAVSTQSCAFALGGDGRIVDFQFLGSSLVLILWAATKDSHPRLIAVPVKSPRISYADFHGESNSLPAMRLAHDVGMQGGGGGGISADGLCWVADVKPPAAAANDKASINKSSPVVRMEVLGPRQVGTDKVESSGAVAGAGNDNDSISMATARVCLMHADGTTYRVFSLPSMEDMFGSIS